MESLRVAATGVEKFGALALDEDCVRPDLEDFRDGEQIRPAHVLQRGDEGAVILLLPLVPEAGKGRESRADVDLVHRGVEPDPRESVGERACIPREEWWPIRILKVARPVRHSEVE